MTFLVRAFVVRCIFDIHVCNKLDAWIFSVSGFGRCVDGASSITEY